MLLSAMKKTAILPRVRCARAFRRSISSTMLWLERKRIESPKNPVTVQKSQPYGQPRPDSIGWGLGRLLADFDRARWMGANGRRTIDERFLWERIADETLAVYGHRELAAAG